MMLDIGFGDVSALPPHLSRKDALASVCDAAVRRGHGSGLQARPLARDGRKAVCPHCGCPKCYKCRRPSGNLRFRCKAFRRDFSITSGTLFAFHKLPLRAYLLAIAVFCNEVKNKSMLALSRDLRTQYKTAFVLAHKMREAMASEMKGAHVGGDGRKAEIDGGYFGGYLETKRIIQAEGGICEAVSGG